MSHRFINFILLFLFFASIRLLPPEEPSDSKYWFFFSDKGPARLQKPGLRNLEENLLPRAKARRQKVLPEGNLVDETDLPLWQPYIDQLSANGIRIVSRTKWLNAVSGYADEEQLNAARQLLFVKEIRHVAVFRKHPPVTVEPPGRLQKPVYYQLDYGQSLLQNEMIRVPAVHDSGNFGGNVLIGVFDTGFRLQHEALQHLITRIVAQYDFINKDNIVDNEEEQDASGQRNHGSQVLSVMAGFKEGELIGPAFDASFLLAKTETISSETSAEEDYWIAAAEWAESLGADIISTSLGYIDWYTYEDMDGQTAPITIAADLAVKKGIVVITSAGNEGNSSWKYITAPADGKLVLSIGAVQQDGSIAAFSSRGPTYDGRQKPEVVAPGAPVYAISPDADSLYKWVSGTSFSCPLTAGVVALMLSEKPFLTPRQVRQALIETADRAGFSDNVYGFGIINAEQAVDYWDDKEPPPAFPSVSVYPNPFAMANGVLRFVFDLDEDIAFKAEIYNMRGQKIITLWNAPWSADQILYWNGLSTTGKPVPSGVYICRFEAGGKRTHRKVTVLN